MKVATIWVLAMCFAASLLIMPSYAQTLYLIGGSLKTCASTSHQNCAQNTHFTNAKIETVYRVSKPSIDAINHFWPSQNTLHKQKTRRLLNAIASPNLLSKSQLVDVLKSTNKALYKAWSDEEYHFVFDHLEVPQISGEKRLKEQVLAAHNNELASTQILTEIANDIATRKHKTLYLVTASSRDPYAAADFYANLFSDYAIKSEWLPLTPALAAALANNDCANLDGYRNSENKVFNRTEVYPDWTASEQALCEQGLSAISEKISQADAIFFNGGDQSLTKRILVNAKTQQSYPWTDALKTRPILIGTSAGTAVQAGGKNKHGNLVMITNGSSENALINGAFASMPPSENCQRNGECNQLDHDALTYDERGGLGSFTLGLLDTHFSERGRTMRLAVLAQHTHQSLGFGVDETTALKVNKQTKQLSVIGKNGVVVINTLGPKAFNYFYYPSGSQLHLSDFENPPPLAQKAPDQIAISNVIQQGRLRETLQAFCRLGQQELVLEQASLPNIHVIRSERTACLKQPDGRYQIHNVGITW